MVWRDNDFGLKTAIVTHPQIKTFSFWCFQSTVCDIAFGLHYQRNYLFLLGPLRCWTVCEDCYQKCNYDSAE